MRQVTQISRLVICFAGLFLFANVLSAGEKKLMHCFYFTPVESATDADWQAFFKATDALPGKIPGLTKVWYGKLRRNMSIFMPDEQTRKTIKPDQKDVSGQFSRRVRQFGVCMEMENEAALKTYADHPLHKEWEAVYFKVREYGTTTFDIVGQ